MKNLFLLAVLSIIGFASCEQIETVEPASTNINNQNDYQPDYSTIDTDGVTPICKQCVLSEKEEGLEVNSEGK